MGIKNHLCLVGLLLFSFNSFGKIDCEQTMDSIDAINQSQLSHSVGEGGQSLEQLLEKYAQALSARTHIAWLQMTYRGQRRAGGFDFQEAFTGVQSKDESGAVLRFISPACSDSSSNSQACFQAFKALVAEKPQTGSSTPSLARAEKDISELKQALDRVNREESELANLSIIKKKLAQDYVRSCDIQESERAKLEQTCERSLGNGQEEILSLTGDNMRVVGFLAVAQNAVGAAEFNKACKDLNASGRELDVCQDGPRGKQKSAKAPKAAAQRVTPPSENCDKLYEYRDPQGQCFVDERIRDNYLEQKRKRTWSKVGKVATYTGLAGGAVAAGAWIIGKMAGDSSGSSYRSSKAAVPASYRPRHMYSNSRPHGNMNYSHYYGYPGSYGNNAWIGEQSFERASPYSVEGNGLGGPSSSKSFSFGF